MRIIILNYNTVQVLVIAIASQKPHTSVKMDYVELVSAIGMITGVLAGIVGGVGFGIAAYIMFSTWAVNY